MKPFNALTLRVKPWAIQSFLTFYSINRTLKCDHSLETAVKQYLTVVLFVFQLCLVYNFEKFSNFGLGTVRSERVNEASVFSGGPGRNIATCKEVVYVAPAAN